MITDFQLCSLLLFGILGALVVIDPVAAFVIGNFHIILDRWIFSNWYLLVTHPYILAPHAILMPKRSAIYYYRLANKLFHKFPELTNYYEDMEDE